VLSLRFTHQATIPSFFCDATPTYENARLRLAN
jgi:hypothetical protein